MIHIGFREDSCSTRINSVEYREELHGEGEDEGEGEGEGEDGYEGEGEYKGRTFCLGTKTDEIYLLVRLSKSCDCCMVSVTEEVKRVSTKLKPLVDILRSEEEQWQKQHDFNMDEISYEIRKGRLVDHTTYVLETTLYLLTDVYQVRETQYCFQWLFDGSKRIPFPEETVEHFETKQRKREEIRSGNTKCLEELDLQRQKIIHDLSGQIETELRIKKNLLEQLDTLCHLGETKHQLKRLPTTTQRLLEQEIRKIYVSNTLHEVV